MFLQFYWINSAPNRCEKNICWCQVSIFFPIANFPPQASIYGHFQLVRQSMMLKKLIRSCVISQFDFPWFFSALPGFFNIFLEISVFLFFGKIQPIKSHWLTELWCGPRVMHITTPKSGPALCTHPEKNLQWFVTPTFWSVTSQPQTTAFGPLRLRPDHKVRFSNVHDDEVDVNFPQK